MKIVSSKQMSDLEKLAYRDGASESEFMEEAGSGVALVVHDFVERYNLSKQVLLLCASGNNSGDAYVAGCDLLQLDYDVTALQVTPINDASQLCKQNYARFIQMGGLIKEDNVSFEQYSVIVDGLFGTGFHGSLKEPFASIVTKANESKVPIIAVDIPSGLDGETGVVEGVAIHAAETAFLGLPKLGLFLNDGWNHIGKLRYVDFGLGNEYIEEVSSSFTMLSLDILRPLMPSLIPDRHKYQAGYVVGVAGSPGMAGAALLASWSALTAGAGIVRLMHPLGMEEELASSPYELIKTAYQSVDDILKQMKRASAIFIGPAMGTDSKARDLLKSLLPQIKIPCVLDADALTILATEKIPLPEKTILTPHHGEMANLLGEPAPKKISREYLEKCLLYAKTQGVTLVLKGGPTFVLQADEPIFVNSLGDPGMATAGSGDVLTGMIASLLAQGVKPLDAANLGIYLHALAGEYAAVLLTSYCMTASDIVEHYPLAFHTLVDKTI